MEKDTEKRKNVVNHINIKVVSRPVLETSVSEIRIKNLEEDKIEHEVNETKCPLEVTT